MSNQTSFSPDDLPPLQELRFGLHAFAQRHTTGTCRTQPRRSGETLQVAPGRRGRQGADQGGQGRPSGGRGPRRGSDESDEHWTRYGQGRSS